MGIEVQYAPLPTESIDNKGKSEILDLRLLKVGAGSRIFQVDKEAVKLGSASIESAKIILNYDGSAIFKTPTGTKIIDTGSIEGDFIEVINSKLNTASQTILKGFTFEDGDYAGNLYAGNITWDETTGLPTGGTGFLINAKGILGVKSGVTTVSILNTGDATFGGNLSAPTGTLGAITLAASGNIKAGKTSYSDDTNAGFWLGLDSGVAKINIGSSTTKYLHYDGSNWTLVGGSITSATFQTTGLTTGQNIIIDSTGFTYKYNNSLRGYLYCASSSLLLQANNDLYLSADDGLLISSGSDMGVICDDWRVGYNDDNDGSDCYWFSNSSQKMKLTSSGNLNVDGDISADNFDIAEMYESIAEYSDKKIPNGTSVVLVDDKIRPAKQGETPFGVISATAGLIINKGGSDAGSNWGKKYLRNDLGEFIYEDAQWWSVKKIKTDIRKKPNMQQCGWVDETTKIPKNSVITTKSRKKLNHEWDRNIEYAPRQERPEWNIVGLIGRVRILKGQPTNKNWIKLKEISDTVEEWLIK